MNYFKPVLVILLILLYVNGFAQSDIRISTTYHPSSRYLPPADSMSKEGNSQHHEVNLSSHFGIYRKIDTATGKVRIVSGAAFARFTRFSSNGFNKTVLPDNLYAASGSISYYATINRRWAYTAFLNTSVNSDLKAVDYNDLFLTGGVVFLRQFSPNFRMGFGAIVHNNLGTPIIWPALSVDWHFGQRFNFDIRVPDEGQGMAYNIGVGYKINDKTRAGFAFKPQMIAYDVETRGPINNRLMNFWQLPFELSLTRKAGRLEYSGGLGFSAVRRFAYARKKLENMFTEYPYYGLGANGFVNLGVKYNL